MAEKITGLTEDMAQANFAALAQLFPSCVVEQKVDAAAAAAVADVVDAAADAQATTVRHSIDVDKLLVLIGCEADAVGTAAQALVKAQSQYEPFGFMWAGKRQAVAEANQVIDKTLRPCVEESLNFDHARNLFIEGDNLEGLKLLLRGYSGSIKMIYTDPPYNTGSDFVYKDSFAQSQEDYEREAGISDEQGQRFTVNRNTDARFHSKWCSMMYARLSIMRHLLTRDGFIIISIDDNEQAHLKLMCDEIFGEQNFVAQMIWSAGRKNDSRFVSISHEYLLVYMRDKDYVVSQDTRWRERKQGLDEIYSCYAKLKRKYGTDVQSIERELKAWFSALPAGHPAKDHSHYDHVDENGIFNPSNISFPGGGGPRYELLHPVTHKPVKIPSRGWFTSKERMMEYIAAGRVYFGPDENRVPTIKNYLQDKELSVPYSVFYQDGRAASKRLDKLMGGRVFENPKDEQILQRLMEFSGTTDDDIILDVFAGSASTAEAVLRANAKDGAQRRFILMQYPEPCPAKSVAAQHGFSTICEIGKERIRKVISDLNQSCSNMVHGGGVKALF